jgi:lauroyl-KDO2-lipid IV(A) myristoyltransferase
MKPSFQKAWLAPRYWGIWSGIGFVRILSWLPQSWRHGIAHLLGVIAWRVNHKRRLIVLTNLELCFSEKTVAEREALGRAHFIEMARSLPDMGLNWFASDERLLKTTCLEGWEHYEQARAKGKNVIMHVAHSAGLDLGAMTIGSRVSGVGPYNAVKNPLLDYFISRGRRRFDIGIFERGDGMLAYTRALKRGKLLYTLTDEDFGPEQSVYAPFFGQEKATLTMIARLAEMANAVVLPTYTHFDQARRCYLTRIFSPLDNFPEKDAEANAARLNASLEMMIRTAPEAYMWTLRIFKTQRAGQRVYRYR